MHIGKKWMFRTANDLAWLLTHEAVEPKRMSRAAVETLAIIAYHQPVTRAEIEDIRGVSTSKGSIDVLLQTAWIRPRGRRKAPGRPLTYGHERAVPRRTFGLEALSDLPGLDELKGSGLLDGRLLGRAFAVPVPSDDPAVARGRGSARAGRSRSQASRRGRSRPARNSARLPGASRLDWCACVAVTQRWRLGSRNAVGAFTSRECGRGRLAEVLVFSRVPGA